MSRKQLHRRLIPQMMPEWFFWNFCWIISDHWRSCNGLGALPLPPQRRPATSAGHLDRNVDEKNRLLFSSPCDFEEHKFGRVSFPYWDFEIKRFARSHFSRLALPLSCTLFDFGGLHCGGILIYAVNPATFSAWSWQFFHSQNSSIF